MILAGRRINDGMGAYVAGQMIKAMLKKGVIVQGARVLVMGLTFKENCPDLRNTRVIDVVRELKEYGLTVDVYDPWADADCARQEYGLDLLDEPAQQTYDGIVLAVAHREFEVLGVEAVHALGKANHVLFDIKYLFASQDSDFRL